MAPCGYCFGDKPVNRTLALYLKENTFRRLRVWAPRPDRERYLERLRLQLQVGEGTIADNQVEVEDVTLPDAEAVKRLRTELNE